MSNGDFSTVLAREAILKRVRAAVAPLNSDRAAARAEALAYLAQNVRGPQPTLDADLVERFVKWSIEMGSTVSRIADINALPAEVKRYCDTLKVAPKVCVWPQFGDLNWTSAGVAAENRPAVGSDLTCVTGVAAGIAETGTILITPSADAHTAAVLLPENHIAVVPSAQIVGTMEDAIAKVKAERGSVPRAMNFISGPSRTADIEQTLVIGAHGPIRVHVIVVG